VLKGVAPVEVTRITFDDIRTGAWRKGAAPEPAAVERPPVEVAQAASAPPAAVAEAPAASTPGADDTSPPPVAAAKAARGFWVQLGAFRQREGADGFQRRVVTDLDWIAPLLGVFSEPNGYRLQAGPYASRDEAQGVARRVREALSLVPVIVERK